MRLQSAIEFLTTYAWVFIIIAVFIAVISAFISIKNPIGFVPSSCYIAPELPCYTLAFMSNSSASTFIIIFSNNIGATMQFPANSITLIPTTAGTSFTGSCLPANVPNGASVVCKVIANGYTPSIGSQATPSYTLTYDACYAGKCTGPYNSTGFGTVSISAYKQVVASVNVIPTNSITIVLNGESVSQSAAFYFVTGKDYYLYAIVPNGAAFGGWSVTGGITLNSTTSKTVVATVSGSGSITAV
ncbi:MAG: hypothetical protein QXT36_03825 [Candidatus Micrarchaeaceae archaeon]